jgi:hypothetical protein
MRVHTWTVLGQSAVVVRVGQRLYVVDATHVSTGSFLGDAFVTSFRLVGMREDGNLLPEAIWQDGPEPRGPGVPYHLMHV